MKTHVKLTAAAAWLVTAAAAGSLPAQEGSSRATDVSDSRLAAQAVLALPEALREGAEVRKHGPDGLVTIQGGSNGMICLADEPGDGRFGVACYHESLEPFMAAGRELSARGMTGMERQEARWEAVEEGEVPMPDHAAMVYNLGLRNADAATVDPDTVDVEQASRLHALYLPYATPESTGLPTRPSGAAPWLMWPGRPSAHVMITIPPKGGGG